MPNCQWECPKCGEDNSKTAYCGKCFYVPLIPKQRLSVIAVALGVGSVLLVTIGVWLFLAEVTFGATLVIVGGLMGWVAAKW